MSVPPTSTSSSSTQPPVPVGDASKSVLLAAQAMTFSSPVASTTNVYSTRQYSDETLMTAEALLAISERPSTSLSQSVDVVMETPDPEVILPGKFPLVATKPFVCLCDPLAVTLPLHSTPLESPSSQKHQFVLERSISHLFPASLQAHRFYRHKYHSHSHHLPVYRKTYIGPQHQPEVFIYLASKTGLTLKTGLGFVQGHWKLHHLIDRIRG